MTKNTINLMDIIQEQTMESTGNRLYTNFASKKALLDSKLLNEKQAEIINNLKHCFSFSITTDNTHLAITMYYSKNKQYNYLAVNLETMETVQFDSIKETKKYISNKLVQETVKQPAKPVKKADKVK